MRDEKINSFVSHLLKWHKGHRRTLPWRVSRDPYRVLIAELMLQRTRADQVAEIYNIFIKKYPDPVSAASADPTSLIELLEHLGLRHRIPRFIELVKKLSADYGEQVPDKFEDLIKLPGVGPYIANAVLCFGFRKAVPIVDANIVRVFTRFFGLSSTKKRAHTDQSIWEFAKRLLPNRGYVWFNEAILDFAAMVCKPKPLCQLCPISNICTYYPLATKRSLCSDYTPDLGGF